MYRRTASLPPQHQRDPNATELHGASSRINPGDPNTKTPNSASRWRTLLVPNLTCNLATGRSGTTRRQDHKMGMSCVRTDSYYPLLLFISWLAPPQALFFVFYSLVVLIRLVSLRVRVFFLHHLCTYHEGFVETAWRVDSSCSVDRQLKTNLIRSPRAPCKEFQSQEAS